VVTEFVEAPPFGVGTILCPSGEVALSLALSVVTAEGELTPATAAGWRPVTVTVAGRDDVPVGYTYRLSSGSNVVAVTCAPVT
jgi:hypothetical protein